MTDAVTISVINGIFSVTAVVVGLVVKKNVNKVHQQINSRMDEMLKMSKELSRAEGKEEQRLEQEKNIK